MNPQLRELIANWKTLAGANQLSSRGTDDCAAAARVLLNCVRELEAALAAPKEAGVLVGEIVPVYEPVCSVVTMFNADLPIGTKLYAANPPVDQRQEGAKEVCGGPVDGRDRYPECDCETEADCHYGTKAAFTHPAGRDAKDGVP